MQAVDHRGGGGVGEEAEGGGDETTTIPHPMLSSAIDIMRNRRVASRPDSDSTSNSFSTTGSDVKEEMELNIVWDVFEESLRPFNSHDMEYLVDVVRQERVTSLSFVAWHLPQNDNDDDEDDVGPWGVLSTLFSNQAPNRQQESQQLVKLKFNAMNLATPGGGRLLLSSLQGNNCIRDINLTHCRLGGTEAGSILASLLLNVPHLQTLEFCMNPVGREGALRLLQDIAAAPSSSFELREMNLTTCHLGDAGVQALVETLLLGTSPSTSRDNVFKGNHNRFSSLRVLNLGNNRITSHGLGHLTRLLDKQQQQQQQRTGDVEVPPLKSLLLMANRGVLDNQATTRAFAATLTNSRTTNAARRINKSNDMDDDSTFGLEHLNVDHCNIPGRVAAILLQTLQSNTTGLRTLFMQRGINDIDLRNGLRHCLPRIHSLQELGVNCGFTTRTTTTSQEEQASLVRALFRNTSILRLRCPGQQEQDNDQVAMVLERNQLFIHAKSMCQRPKSTTTTVERAATTSVSTTNTSTTTSLLPLAFVKLAGRARAGGIDGEETIFPGASAIYIALRHAVEGSLLTSSSGTPPLRQASTATVTTAPVVTRRTDANDATRNMFSSSSLQKRSRSRSNSKISSQNHTEMDATAGRQHQQQDDTQDESDCASKKAADRKRKRAL